MIKNKEYSPIVISGPSGAGKTELIEYLKKRDLLNSLSSGVSLQVIDELGYCDEIIREMPKITSYLSDVNTLTYEQLAENDYKRLLEELNRQVKT